MSINEQIAALAAELAATCPRGTEYMDEQYKLEVDRLTRTFTRLVTQRPDILIRLGELMGAYCEERGVGQASTGVIGGEAYQPRRNTCECCGNDCANCTCDDGPDDEEPEVCGVCKYEMPCGCSTEESE